MPRLIETNPIPAITLEELVSRLDEGNFDPRDEDCFASFGQGLRQLAENEHFLADLVIAELERNCASQSSGNQYGPQVFMLHRGERYAIRANFWPALDDAVVENNGPAAFFYEVPHDHNFSFLTVGYSGPGYISDYYEYDYDSVLGVPGEQVALRFVERSQLHPGKTMLYRAHRDAHSQLPPESLSVSINILEQSASLPYRDQYQFDLERRSIDSILTNTPVEALLDLCAGLASAEGHDLLENFAHAHPCDRIRHRALVAFASMQSSPAERDAVFERGARGDNPYVARMSADALASVR
ncbi:MAG: transposase [Pseudomonadota bacterium]